jgi:hypothetical protein
MMTASLRASATARSVLLCAEINHERISRSPLAKCRGVVCTTLHSSDRLADTGTMPKDPSPCELDEPTPMPGVEYHKLAVRREWLGIVEAPDAKAGGAALPAASRRKLGGLDSSRANSSIISSGDFSPASSASLSITCARRRRAARLR